MPADSSKTVPKATSALTTSLGPPSMHMAWAPPAGSHLNTDPSNNVHQSTPQHSQYQGYKVLKTRVSLSEGVSQRQSTTKAQSTCRYTCARAISPAQP